MSRYVVTEEGEIVSRESETVTGMVSWLNSKNLLTREELGLRIIKLTEEVGEVSAAWIGFTGQNPRKGITHTKEDVVKELLDVSVTALVAAESIHGSPVWNKFYGHMHGLLRRTQENN